MRHFHISVVIMFDSFKVYSRNLLVTTRDYRCMSNIAAFLFLNISLCIAGNLSHISANILRQDGVLGVLKSHSVIVLVPDYFN